MGTDAIGGRKFAAFIICTLCYVLILYFTVTNGLLNGDLVQTFLFFLVAIQGIFFGGNIADKFISNKLNGVNNDNEQAKPA